MSRGAVAWVFNLDAEDELRRGGPHTPSRATTERAKGYAQALQALLAPGDVVLWPEGSGGAPPRGMEGRAWCPTPWALSQMARAGLRVPPAPSAPVLRRVNHRRFAFELGGVLPASHFVTKKDELLDALADASALARASVTRSWLLKLPLGYAGRGRRLVSGPELSAADRLWIDAALSSEDGLLVEPLVDRRLDAGIHGWLGEDGALSLGEPTVSRIDASGRWTESRRAEATELRDPEREALLACARDTARSLHAAGYFGPLGLDAFRWAAPDGAEHFQPRCEINARYSMGWATGMGR